MKLELKIILFTLAAHLFYSNSELLIAAKECAQNGITTFDKVVLTAFALSYSVMTTVSVFALKKIFPVIIFALLDGFAVYLRIYVDQQHFIIISALFYGFYTAYIIVIAFMLKNAVTPTPPVEPSTSAAVPTEKRSKKKALPVPKNQASKVEDSAPTPQPETAKKTNFIQSQLTLF